MTDHAIVVGIRTYPGLQSLAGLAMMRLEFRNWLEDPNGGNFNPGNIAQRLSTDFPPPTGVADAHPTLDDLETLFRPLVTQAAAGVHIRVGLSGFRRGAWVRRSARNRFGSLIHGKCRVLVPAASRGDALCELSAASSGPSTR